MKQFLVFISVAVLVTQVFTAPQLISFTDGKLGVNFGGYHAAVGLGGLLGNGAGGGLFAEAGTPHGQSAKAGLGGAVNPNGGTAGGLYAGATAGGNVRAAAGLAGGVNSEGTSGGTGFAAAQAGNRFSSSSLFQSGKDPSTSPALVGQNIKDNLPNRSFNQNVQYELKSEDTNELKPVGENIKVKNFAAVTSGITNIAPNKDVEKQFDEEKEISVTHYQPNRNQLDKTAYIGGFAGTTSDNGQNLREIIHKRYDIGNENINEDGSTQPEIKSVDQISYRKEVNIGRNPHFFEDIFNIPIAALQAVRTLLTNTAENTSVSIQKSGSFQAETESISPKHASPSSVKSSDTQISVKTPNASQLLDDILAIPINTLGAVNKFLDNNVPVRKRITVENGDQPIRFNGRHARRRALKKEIIEQKSANLNSNSETNN